MTMVKHHSKSDSVVAVQSSQSASIVPQLIQDAQEMVAASSNEFGRADSASTRKVDSVNVENERS
eukprot:CAMPEP_0184705430 /NCGR_PEP_ID=MMETSP0313-20130426/34343_1 /TAXON_ID=2792 /ORGANISM="Porphyridium aerugineum, Strain SAG 1380-2" /LENGTH=64 /DNA_ID=CAMNT_0027166775 /DNA_START=40 /DNA_END=230 /DNA_ORIENTATION=-